MWLPPNYVKPVYVFRLSNLLCSLTVWCGCEKSGCSWPNTAVLCPPSGQPGVRRHLTSARLPQWFKQPDVRAYAQHEPPQRQSQYQQQRPVRAEPKHQHHVGAREEPWTHPFLFPVPLPLFHTVTINQYQWKNGNRNKKEVVICVSDILFLLVFNVFFSNLVCWIHTVLVWNDHISFTLFFLASTKQMTCMAFIPTVRKAFP